MSDPTTTLYGLIAAETSHSKASIEEINGKMYFHNPEAASSAMVLVNAARRGKRIKISDREDKTTRSTLGLAMEGFTLGLEHSTSYSRSRSLEVELYEPSVSDHVVEILKAAPHWESAAVIRAIEIGNQMLLTGKIGAIDPVAAQSSEPLFENAEFEAPPQR